MVSSAVSGEGPGRFEKGVSFVRLRGEWPSRRSFAPRR